MRPVQDRATDSRPDFLAVAEEIAQRLCRQAHWVDTGCVWDVPAADAAEAGTVEGANGFLYEGTAGIALFLLHLWRRVPEETYLLTARAALAYAVAREKAAGPRHGYYAGTAGVAAMCAELASMTSEERWLDEARALCRTLAGNEGRQLEGQLFEGSGRCDLMVGEAGSLLGLLRVWELCGDDALLSSARRLGKVLLAHQRREPEGIAWPTMGLRVRRHLLGISHGAGGIALALLELYRATADPRFFAAATQGLRYEDGFYDEAARNWPDLRNLTLSDYLEKGDIKALQKDLTTNRYQPSPPKMMVAWCHGAPGIGLVRARFLRLTGLERYRAGLENAARTTLEHLLETPLGNHSLCHGAVGNADILLELAAALDDEPMRAAAVALAERCIDEVVTAGKPWRSGYPEGSASPGLMMGEAGVGLFYLRLAAPEIPTPLLPVPRRPLPASTAEPPSDDERVVEAARAAAWSHFERTRRALERAGADLSGIDPESPQELRDVIEKALDARGQVDSGKLREILALESMVLESLCERQDISSSFARSLMRRPVGILDEAGIRIELAASSRLFFADHDWEPLLSGETELDRLPETASCYLVHAAGDTFRIRPLDTLAAKMYSLLLEPIAVTDLVEKMIEHLAAEDILEPDAEESDVRERLLGTLKNAYRSEMIDVADPELEPEDIDGDLCMRCGECCKIKIEILGNETYFEFVREMLEEPLRAAYPDLRIYLKQADDKEFIVLDLGYCRHLDRSTDATGEERLVCGIYDRRPQVCRSFNCVSWWRQQRLITTQKGPADAVIEKVVTLMGRRTRNPIPS